MQGATAGLFLFAVLVVFAIIVVAKSVTLIPTPSQSGCAMRDKPLSESPACTPARFPPPRRFGPSPSSFVAWLKLRSSWRRCIDGGKSSREPSRPSSKAVPCALLCV